MSLRVVGGAGSRTPPVSSYTLPGLITTNAIPVPTPLPPAPVAPTPTVVVTATTTSIPDTPAFAVVSVKPYITPGQHDALRSAATNTALAFSLPVTISADRATQLQTQILQEMLSVPVVTIDTVIIPP